MGGGNMTNLLSFFLTHLYLRISPPSSVRICSLGSPNVSTTQSLVVWPHSTCLSVSFSMPVYCSSVWQTMQPLTRTDAATRTATRPISLYLCNFILSFSLFQFAFYAVNSVLHIISQGQRIFIFLIL